MRRVLGSVLVLVLSSLPCAAQSAADVMILLRGIEDGVMSSKRGDSPTFRWTKKSDDPLTFAGATISAGRQVELESKIAQIGNCRFELSISGVDSETKSLVGSRKHVFDLARATALGKVEDDEDPSQTLSFDLEGVPGFCATDEPNATCETDGTAFVVHDGAVKAARVRAAYEAIKLICK